MRLGVREAEPPRRLRQSQELHGVELGVWLCFLLTLIITLASSVPSEPGPGQRCAGRNYNGRRCCTPEQPCDEGEGDCDGPGDGGQHDGHAGCKGDLVCGSNNCLKFGAYFHEKDDCCEKPTSAQVSGWSTWEAWGPCSKNCGIGRWSRERHCSGAGCRHKHQLQTRFCNTQPCAPLFRNK